MSRYDKDAGRFQFSGCRARIENEGMHGFLKYPVGKSDSQGKEINDSDYVEAFNGTD